MLHSLSIAEAHKKLASKEVSAEDIMKACIDRIEAVDGSLNAIVTKNFDRALAQAKFIDAKGDFTHPLSGIPYLSKDVFCENGVRTSASSDMLRNKDYVSPFDSTVTRKLKEAGAISLGKVNTDEFTMGASTETSAYGVTRNPWDTERVAGGSSGGSAASVSADECIFSLGTDTGGSIRQPAGFCGITGIRPTYGRVSRFGVMSMASSLDTIGPMAKTIEDLAILMEAMAGKDPLDATTADVPVPSYTKALTGDVKGLKIGLPKEYFLPGMDGAVEAAVRDAAKHFESLGATVHDISLPHTKYAVATYYVICPCEVSSNMSRYDGIRYGHHGGDLDNLVDYYFAARSGGFGKEVKRRIMIGTYALSAGYFDAYYRQAQKVRSLLRQDFTEAFKTVDVILSPISPSPAFKVGAHEGDPVAMYLEDVFSVAQAMAGIPSVALPCGFTPVTPSSVTLNSSKGEGLPIGMQLMGPQWGEEGILKAAHAYERSTDWHTKKPPL